MKRRWMVLLAILLAGFTGVGVFVWSPERFVNRVEVGPLPEVSARAAAIHASTLVVDLHADSLLFGRDLSRRSDVGHVDLPRLREGGVGLQVFAVPTVVPLGMSMEHTPSDPIDMLDWTGNLMQPGLGDSSPVQRAQLAAAALAKLARDSQGQVCLLYTSPSPRDRG